MDSLLVVDCLPNPKMAYIRILDSLYSFTHNHSIFYANLLQNAVFGKAIGIHTSLYYIYENRCSY